MFWSCTARRVGLALRRCLLLLVGALGAAALALALAPLALASGSAGAAICWGGGGSAVARR